MWKPSFDKFSEGGGLRAVASDRFIKDRGQALRGRRCVRENEPLLEELAEGAAESAALVGLDETSDLPSFKGAHGA